MDDRPNDPLPRNPHFDGQRRVWSDAWSGQYAPPPGGYPAQFEEKGRLWRDDHVSPTVPEGVKNHPTGPGPEWLAYNTASLVDRAGGGFRLDRPFDRAFFQGRTVLDVGCGLGRWTHVLQNLGAGKVVSLDASPAAVDVVRTINPHTFQADLFDLLGDRTHAAAFDVALAWAVLMHTHDPRLAFLTVASTVRRRGSLYVYVHGENGFHDSKHFNAVRQTFHSLSSFAERLAFAERTLPATTLPGTSTRNLLGWYDLLCPFYHWVIPLEVVVQWYREHDFRNITLLNRGPVVAHNASGYHVVGELAATDKPVCDAELEEVLTLRAEERRRHAAEEVEEHRKLEKFRKGRRLSLRRFRRDAGHCFTVPLPGGAELKELFLYENETPLLPGNALHETVQTQGRGSYVIWPAGEQYLLYMSTSDNTDPNRNGRTYSLRWAG